MNEQTNELLPSMPKQQTRRNFWKPYTFVCDREITTTRAPDFDNPLVQLLTAITELVLLTNLLKKPNLPQSLHTYSLICRGKKKLPKKSSKREYLLVSSDCCYSCVSIIFSTPTLVPQHHYNNLKNIYNTLLDFFSLAHSLVLFQSPFLYNISADSQKKRQEPKLSAPGFGMHKQADTGSSEKAAQEVKLLLLQKRSKRHDLCIYARKIFPAQQFAS
jgi:hypothetical protein